MNLKNQFRCFIGAYYGITYMDEYPLKEYVLKDIENYIRDFISINYVEGFDYLKESEDVLDNVSVITKLQDSLYLLNKIDGSMELILLIKNKLKELK